MSEKDLRSLIDSLVKLSIQDLKFVIDVLKNEYGLEATTQQVVVAQTPVEEVVEEQTEFDVVVNEAGPTKLAVIKLVKELTGKGLTDSKRLIDECPAVIGEKINLQTANEWKTALETLGATVVLK